MNEEMDISQIQNVLKTFQKESMKAEMKQETVADAMDMGLGNVDEEADDVYNNILGEIGLEYEIADPTRVKTAIKKKEEEKVAAKEADDDLEARLAALKM